MSAKETSWLSGSKRPHREGVYKRRYGGSDDWDYAYWSPEGGWGIGASSFSVACDLRHNYSSFQPDGSGGRDFEWRGLATKPK